MRWWPTRARRRSTPRPPEDLLVTEEMLRRGVEDVLVVRDRQLRGGIFVFRGILTMQPGRALDVLIERFRPIGVGTFGALILLRSPARNRNSLFAIAAAGPLAGLAVAFPAILLGFAWSSVVPVPPGGYVAFGDSLLTWALTYLRFGPIPSGHMVFTHPIADAAWAGFLVTALNLFPVGQLDGGRIAYALFGRHHRVIGKATVATLLVVGVASFLWGLSAP